MQMQSNIVIIGGIACGPNAGAKARRLDPQARTTIIEQGKDLCTANCGLPYYVSRVIDGGDDFLFLDARNLYEWETCRIEAPQVMFLPLPELRTKLEVLPKNREMVIFCWSSTRAYQSQRILEGAGFENVKFMDGSIVAWPYETFNARHPHP
jgi:rhodanese-related sulfurtransferase